MFANRLTDEYNEGVNEFIRFAVEHAEDPSRIICPCLQCCYSRKVSPTELKTHLVCYGIDQSYTCWTRHGETREEFGNLKDDVGYALNDVDTNSYDGNRFDEMAAVLEEDLRDCPDMFERMMNDAEKPLYDDLLTLLKDMLPKNNELPNRTYEAKQVIRSTGMGYKKIHACRNDCILFWKEYESLRVCPKCNESRYKKEYSTPEKVLWYFPIKERFRRMYNNAIDAKNLTWHADERIKDGKLRHPADSPQWRKIDHEYPDFAQDARNLHLALSTNGINPHGVQRSSHSTWPVMLVIYNLPPWLCMKRKYMMLSMLISGPKQPGNDIDVYLTPLIEDLKQMWETGIEVYRRESFNLRAMLFGTISDFSAYGNLSGYSTKGQCACPICEDNTHWMQLENYKKNVFLGHCRFLPPGHRYRGWRKAFNGKREDGKAPLPLTGEQLFEKLKSLSNNFGKPFAGELVTNRWKKRSIFFELPYWKELYVRHFLDVMHIEKNLFDGLIGTLLNMVGKTKDGLNARLDLLKLGIRTELRPIKRGKRTYLPPACYTLSRKEKIKFSKNLHGVKVPEGYSSNIKNLVSVKDLKLKGLKSHDCHVLMENLVPICIRSILPQKVRRTITKLCLFFKAICSKVIDPGKLPKLQREIILTLCELEMYFPPSFFDIMVHLTVHLYIVEEVVEFCTDYMSNVDSIGLLKSRHLNINPDSVSERLRWLANGPSIHVLSYTGYLINGYTFYTKEQDDQSTIQNSGVTLVAEAMHVSSANDRNPIYANMSYFGVIEHIWELDYSKFCVPVFGCKWVDNNDGFQIDDLGFMQVDLNREGYKDEPFILASQAQQVFYVADPVDMKWSIVILSNKINANNIDDQDLEDTDVEDDPFFGTSQLHESDPVDDDDLYLRDDHDEGIFINPQVMASPNGEDPPLTSPNGEVPPNTTTKKRSRGMTTMKKSAFDVDETRKEYILKSAGKSHRQFRTTMGKYVRDADGNINLKPPKKYENIIREADGLVFVKKRTEDKSFLKLSEENRKRASKCPYPYRKSRAGYRGVEKDIIGHFRPVPHPISDRFRTSLKSGGLIAMPLNETGSEPVSFPTKETGSEPV
ncbi:hypothetical protein RIF29_29752 [Crotalaria pallida]|uniref:Transposase n=1 Tax=Crotalaria pallida TaxID=3830 RepID=A0AAN9EFG1_CROPI